MRRAEVVGGSRWGGIRERRWVVWVCGGDDADMDIDWFWKGVDVGMEFGSGLGWVGVSCGCEE